MPVDRPAFRAAVRRDDDFGRRDEDRHGANQAGSTLGRYEPTLARLTRGLHRGRAVDVLLAEPVQPGPVLVEADLELAGDPPGADVDVVGRPVLPDPPRRRSSPVGRPYGEPNHVSHGPTIAPTLEPTVNRISAEPAHDQSRFRSTALRASAPSQVLMHGSSRLVGENAADQLESG